MSATLTEVKHKETGQVICNFSACTVDELKGIDLTEADLRGADLSGIDFHGTPMVDLYSLKPKPTHPTFNRADLSSANLSNSRLCYAYFEGANLSHANLEGADLFEANLENADLRGASLKNASLVRTFLHGAKYDLATQWPKDFLKKGQKLEHFGLVLMQDETERKEIEAKREAHRKYVVQQRTADGLCPMCGKKLNRLEILMNGGKRQHKACTQFQE